MRDTNYNGNPIPRGEARYDCIMNDSFRTAYGIASEAEQTRDFILDLFDGKPWAIGRDWREYYGEPKRGITEDERKRLVQYRRGLVESTGNAFTDGQENWQDIVKNA